MSLVSRVCNVFRGDRLAHEIDEEFESHIQDAIAAGRDPDEARRAFGSALRHREHSRDIRLVGWLDSLRSDAIFGWRQLRKTKVVSTAAVLSLALAIGACTAAFRLIDALLLRPLPIAHTDRLYEVSSQTVVNGDPSTFNSWAYPSFELMRAAVRDQAELLAVSSTERTDIAYRSTGEPEWAFLQYVSGRLFPAFDMRPALGRLLTGDDDRSPGAHPYAVVSHDYWARRFGRNPDVIGRTFRLGDRVYQIVGVAPSSFTGTQPGIFVDIFVPIQMHPAVNRPDQTWHQTLALMRPGAALEPVRARLQTTYRGFNEARLKGAMAGIPKGLVERFLNRRILLEPAAQGASNLRTETRRPLSALGVLVILVLLIACGNVANLMAAQGAARKREMALRVSIGGGRARLVQLVLVQSAWLAMLAAALGGAFAWWAGPFVAGMINPPDNPVRLSLPADWRVFGFGLSLAIAVTLLFGLYPALRASVVLPANALKSVADVKSGRRLMHALVAVQVAFCFLVLFVAGLFVTSFERLSRQPVGFAADRLLILDLAALSPQPAAFWAQATEHLRGLRGVEAVALADQPLLAGGGWANLVSIHGEPPNGVPVYMRAVSPGWAETLRIPLIEGRDLRPSDTGTVLVNLAFSRAYFGGTSPIGQSFDIVFSGNVRRRVQAVGMVGDVRYATMREPTLPQLYVPFLDSRKRDSGVLIVRTSNPNLPLRQELQRVRPEFRLSRFRTQLDINQSHTVRERLLATLALFFAMVALVLAGVGLYGVLHYSVVERRRELGIRIAIGASAGSIARSVAGSLMAAILAGAIAGLTVGLAVVRFIALLLYQVKPTDASALAIPALALFGTASLAALPVLLRAIRIEPSAILRDQ